MTIMFNFINIISRSLFALLWKLCWANFFLPSPMQLREIHHCQPVDQKRRGGEKTDTAKLKKGKVGGDDVGSEDTERREPDNRQWWSVCVGGCSRCVCVWETERQVLQVDQVTRGSSGLWVLLADSACPPNPSIPYLLCTEPLLTSSSSHSLLLSFYPCSHPSSPSILTFQLSLCPQLY